MPHTPNTPNYDLQKVDPTDPVRDFRSLFNNNMDKIDNITGGGGGGGAGGKILKNKTLTFTNLVATVSDSDIKADSDFAVYYYDVTIAQNADITAVSSNGVITFTAQNTPQSTIVCDIVLFGVSSGGGGVANLYGTTTPTDDQGSDGQFYVKYNSILEKIDGVFFKINGHWMNTDV